jgi:hypothetical protein
MGQRQTGMSSLSNAISGGMRSLRQIKFESVRDWRSWSSRLNLAAALSVAVVVGLGGTWYALTSSRGVRDVISGPWRAVIEIGAAEANPYARAIIARRGSAPMLAAELISFTATRDSRGARLTSDCVYELHGTQLETRLWTMAVLEAEGNALPVDGGPHEITSQGVLRARDGSFEITLAERANPGNWLSTGHDQRLSLVLRLYDTPLFANGGLTDIKMPEIVPVRCS